EIGARRSAPWRGHVVATDICWGTPKVYGQRERRAGYQGVRRGVRCDAEIVEADQALNGVGPAAGRLVHAQLVTGRVRGAVAPVLIGKIDVGGPRVSAHSLLVCGGDGDTRRVIRVDGQRRGRRGVKRGATGRVAERQENGLPVFDRGVIGDRDGEGLA